MQLKALNQEVKNLKDPEHAKILMRYFKTGPGEYAQGDIFLGIRVPLLRKLAREYRGLPLVDVKKLLVSKFHEERFIALIMMIEAYKSGSDETRNELFKLYSLNTRYINNWDLVDISAEHIVGAFLNDKNKDPLYAFAKSGLLWERRVGILSTFHYLKKKQYAETFTIADILLNDPHDLIHKAVGWMLREVGKRNVDAEEEFLVTRYKRMPRTMLRYAIERFPEKRRQQFLQGDL